MMTTVDSSVDLGGSSAIVVVVVDVVGRQNLIDPSPEKFSPILLVLNKFQCCDKNRKSPRPEFFFERKSLESVFLFEWTTNKFFGRFQRFRIKTFPEEVRSHLIHFCRKKTSGGLSYKHPGQILNLKE